METFPSRYFTPREVAAHARPGDLWVSYLGRVCDLSPLVRQHEGDVLLRPILEAAGKDISHWFNPKTRDIQTHVDPLTGCVKYYTPQGRFIHIPPQLPRSDWANDFGLPWWKDSKYEVGILASKTRHIRIVNTLTSQEHMLEQAPSLSRRPPGVRGGVHVGDPAALPAPQRPRRQLHLEVRGRQPGHGQDAGAEQDPGRGRGVLPAQPGLRPVHAGHLAVFQRRSHRVLGAGKDWPGLGS
ncbi:cytochrome b5 domain-containing protein 1 isoform X2 [Natator depressus]|uniref:cytochrome b5 domain-containing protein 1 isoform X2 n=1 Tax=Natator depressus TaxID=27790 RepID=UPI003EB8F0D6